jgi:hypothetical protein
MRCEIFHHSTESSMIQIMMYETIFILQNLKSFGAKRRNVLSLIINLLFLECSFHKHCHSFFALNKMNHFPPYALLPFSNIQQKSLYYPFFLFEINSTWIHNRGRKRTEPEPVLERCRWESDELIENPRNNVSPHTQLHRAARIQKKRKRKEKKMHFNTHKHAVRQNYKRKE